MTALLSEKPDRRCSHARTRTGLPVVGFTDAPASAASPVFGDNSGVGVDDDVGAGVSAVLSAADVVTGGVDECDWACVKDASKIRTAKAKMRRFITMGSLPKYPEFRFYDLH